MVFLTVLCKTELWAKLSVDVIKSGVQPLFSDEQNVLLSGHIQTLAEIGYGYSRYQLFWSISVWHVAYHKHLRQSVTIFDVCILAHLQFLTSHLLLRKVVFTLLIQV